MEEYRFWKLCQVIGPPNTWEDLPADRLDWALAIDGAMAQAQANREAEAAGG